MSELTDLIKEEEVTLQILKHHVSKVLAEREVNLIDPKVKMERRIEFIDGMVVNLVAGVLSDRVENKEAHYTVVELPRWLKWLDRFTIKHHRILTLEAYHTYPKANVKIPELNRAYINIVKQDYEL